MFNAQDRRAANQAVFMKSIQGLTSTIAAIATVMLVPLLYAATEEWITLAARESWGPDFVELITWLWWLSLWPLIFFAIRASLVTTIMAAALSLALRYV